jgi:uncharacterized protein (DUF1330 family)
MTKNVAIALNWSFCDRLTYKKRTIMSAYIVFTRTKTLDQQKLETYWAGIKATMKGHPIEVLVAYGKHEVLEGDPIEGIVIAKFPSAKAAKDWYGQASAKRSDLRRPDRGRRYLAPNVSGNSLDRRWQDAENVS